VAGVDPLHAVRGRSRSRAELLRRARPRHGDGADAREHRVAVRQSDLRGGESSHARDDGVPLPCRAAGGCGARPGLVLWFPHSLSWRRSGMSAEFRMVMIGAMYENGGNTTHPFLDGHPEPFAYPSEPPVVTIMRPDHLPAMFPV